MSLKTTGIEDPASWDWRDEFEMNLVFAIVPPQEEYTLTSDEQSLVFPSIKDFQRGEYSEGKHLLQVAREFGQKAGDPEYPGLMKYFIREEQRHSRHLADYMKIYNVSQQEDICIDKVFRFLRKQFGLLSEVTVLVTAEMLALLYYDALSRSTQSEVLSTICAQMLHDEKRHVVWQSYTLHRLIRDKDKTYQMRFTSLRKLLFKLTSCIIWHKYQPVMTAGGYTKEQFSCKAKEILQESIQIQEQGKLS